MSTNESITDNPERLAKLLGAESALYVGDLTPLDVLTGSAQRRVEQAKKRAEEASGVFDSAIAGLLSTVTPESLSVRPLTPQQHVKTIEAAEQVTFIRESIYKGGRPTAICASLFDNYFVFQDDLTDTKQAGILRTIGDDVGIAFELDFETVWELYQDAQDKHENRPNLPRQEPR